MESLLRWGLANSTPESAAAHSPRPISELDPAIIDHILGKPDAVRMKETLEIALDESKSEDDRVTALDEFEMLIESIDNANDLSTLKMWEPLISLVKSPSDAICMQAIWVLGTAVQNNPKAQQVLLSYHPLPELLALLSPSSSASAQTRSKIIYCLSGLLKHSKRAVKAFEESGGWEALKAALTDSDITIRRKTAFLLNTLLLQDGNEAGSTSLTTFPADIDSRITSHPVPANSGPDADSYVTSGMALRALRSHGIVSDLLGSVVSPLPSGPDGDLERDLDYEEKVARTLLTYAEMQKEDPWKDIGGAIQDYVRIGDQGVPKGRKDDGPWGLTSKEWDVLKKTT